MSKQWEYKTVSLPNINNLRYRDDGAAEKLKRFLDGFGFDGWELCGIEYGHFIFKREKEE